MDNPPLQEKALLCINALTAEKDKPTKQLWDLFYRISHVALGTCKNPHDTWLKELEDLHQKLVEEKLI